MLCVLWVTQTIGFFGYSSWAPTLLAQEGMSVEKSIFFVALTTVGAPLGCFLAAQITDRFERKWILVVFGAIIALSGLFYGLTFNPIMIVAFGFLVNFFERGYTAVAYAYSPEVFDTRTRSLGTSFSYGLGRLSNAIGPLIIAALYTGAGYQAVFFFIAGTWLFGAIVLALFGRQHPKGPARPRRHPAADSTAGRVATTRPAAAGSTTPAAVARSQLERHAVLQRLCEFDPHAITAQWIRRAYSRPAIRTSADTFALGRCTRRTRAPPSSELLPQPQATPIHEENTDEQDAADDGHRDRSGRTDRIRAAVPHRIRGNARTGHPGPAAAAGNPARTEGRRGHRDGTRRLRVPAARRHRHHRRPEAGLRRQLRVLCWSVPAPADPAWNGQTCCRPTAESSNPRAKRSTPSPPTTSASWCWATRPTPTR